MKIAIMGAGLSGLACAITLEKHGVPFTIFEKRSQVGDRFVNGEALIAALTRPVNDPIAYLSENHGIYLQALSPMRHILFFSEKEQSVLSGQLGFINLRGRDSESFENQLFNQVKTPIRFNSEHSYEQLLQDYTHIVLATGDAAYTSKIQDFQTDLTVTLKGATVEGDFDRHKVGIWLNYDIAPQGYAFLLPYSEKEACITLAYPDYPANREFDLEKLWENFYTLVCRDFNQPLHITDRFEITRYIIGLCEHPRIGNTFFVGNCFGAVMPGFGFGQFESIMTGIYAAQDLCGLGHYSDLTRPFRESYRNSLVLRRTLERLNNSHLDSIVSLVHHNIVQKVLNHERLNPLKLASRLLRPWVN
ncbi:NAD(P)-binding protein [Desulfosporosinus sp.]|uniref:NAD(P)-binding protein n=1 Tax=Desulfosporosinus sp. TaxID=157907 RepID=UPI0025B87DAC|nr:NAD(P)-binding protein [Desulfosporosinus sp.]MBC2724966.1 NAD(P)-binding protein [Desulfosporosinus sp.]